MADEEDILEGVEGEESVVRGSPKKVRPTRRQLVRECDCPKELASEIIEYAQQALDEANASSNPVHKNVAQYIKTKLDKEKGGTWHCIVGAHFGGNITNDAHTLINFQLDGTWFLVFRSGPPEKLPDGWKK